MKSFDLCWYLLWPSGLISLFTECWGSWLQVNDLVILSIWLMKLLLTILECLLCLRSLVSYALSLSFLSRLSHICYVGLFLADGLFFLLPWLITLISLLVIGLLMWCRCKIGQGGEGEGEIEWKFNMILE